MSRKVEIWENRNRSEIWVNKSDIKGEPKPVRVAPGGRLEITPEERRDFNQGAVVDKAFDWFTNGALSQVQLLDTEEDYAELKANPNARSENEIRDLLKLHAKDLKKELANIDSPLVLDRLKEYIESDAGAEDENITIAKRNAVFARHEDLHPVRTGKVFDSYEESIAKPIKLS